MVFGGDDDESQGGGECIGELLGGEGRGLAAMFLMMNEARISVGLGAASLGYSGYMKSLKYARERRQGRSSGGDGQGMKPSAPQVPIVQHADVKRMLIAQKAAVEGAMSLGLYGCMLVDSIQVEKDAMSAPSHTAAASSVCVCGDREAGDETHDARKARCEDLSLLLDTLTPIIKVR
jgi:alkylation response protein AidB-like acyl-CoA dehydrogenase